MKEKKVSIIVPVYNSAEYLAICIESILSLEYKHFEVLLINDGSSDNSGIICDSYAAKDNRIQVFHKTNGGVSSARNLGLENASGEWIVFIDCDDWIEKEFLNPINLDNENIDAIHIGYIKEFPSKKQTIRKPSIEGYIKPEELTIEPNYMFLAVTFFFKKSTIDLYNLRFSMDIKYSEDREFIIKYLLFSNNILCLQRASYFYRANTNSAVYKRRIYDNCTDDLKVINNISNFITQHSIKWDPDLESYFYAMLLNSYISSLAVNKLGNNVKKIKTDMKNTLTLLANIKFSKSDFRLFWFTSNLPFLTITYKRFRAFLSYIYRSILLKQQ